MSVGESVARKDGPDKVRGRTRFVDDYQPEGCWFGATVRSAIPHGRIRQIRFPSEIPWDRFVVVGAGDIPGRNCVPFLTEDLVLLADGYVRHVNEPILLIAGPDREAVHEAARAVEIEYEPLPAILTLDEAMAAGSTEGCAVPRPISIVRGDLDEGFAQADLVVEGTYEVGHQEHVYLETNGFIAWWEPDGQVAVRGSLQCPYYVQRALKMVFDLPDDKVRVIAAPTGGAFGGKEDFPSMLACHAALLSRAAGRPVKVVYDRREDFTSTTKRHPARVHYRTGVRKDGTFTACSVEFALDGGAYITMSPVVLSRGVIHASGPYYYPAIEVRGRCYATHTPPNGAFRGFGVPQAFFGIERHVDRIAARLGLDPLEVRRRNLLKQGMRTATGQLLKEGVSAAEVLADAVARSGYEEARRKPRLQDGVLHGVGIGLYMHGAGFTGSGEARLKSLVGMRLTPDGRVEILTASTDMGQGTLTVFPQIAARAMNVDFDRVFVAEPDTGRVPDSGPTVASRTVTIVGRVVQQLGEDLAARIRAFAAEQFGGDQEDYALSGDSVVRNSSGEPVASLAEVASRMHEAWGDVYLERGYRLNPEIRWDEARHEGDAYPVFAWGCVVVEVTVDPDTLEIHPVRVTASHDIGTVVNPTLAAGQIEGGIAQSIGYGLFEEVHWNAGEMLNPGFTNYIIPTTVDLPDMDVGFVENPFSDGPFGAKGVGELPMHGAAPALANAVAHATGIEVDQLPVTPERLLAARLEQEQRDTWEALGARGGAETRGGTK